MSWSGEIDGYCPHCRARQEIEVSPNRLSHACVECKKEVLTGMTDAFRKEGQLTQCSLCECAHLFHQKDFNRKLGIALLVLGFALAYWTYGISILILTAIDFWLYKKVGKVACCYECGAVYRGFPDVESVPEFQLQLHDYYRSVRSN